MCYIRVLVNLVPVNTESTTTLHIVRTLVPKSDYLGVKRNCHRHQLILKMSIEDQTVDHTNKVMGDDHGTIFALFRTVTTDNLCTVPMSVDAVHTVVL
jgi:hypothetical protein